MASQKTGFCFCDISSCLHLCQWDSSFAWSPLSIPPSTSPAGKAPPYWQASLPHHTQIYLFSLCSLCHVIPPVCCSHQPFPGANDLKPGLRHLPGTDWCRANFLSCNWPLLMFMRWFVHRVHNPLGAKPRLPGHSTNTASEVAWIQPCWVPSVSWWRRPKKSTILTSEVSNHTYISLKLLYWNDLKLTEELENDVVWIFRSQCRSGLGGADRK